MKTRAARLVSPAKVNLFLKVTGKREDGYHNLQSLMCPLSLHDTVRLSLSGGDIRVRCGYPGVPEDGGNLVCRAARLFYQRLGADGGADIEIEKRIPPGAGLGGGSSNAAAVLLGLNRMLGEPFQLETLMEMGAGLGADVPFFILGRPALAEGIGEILTPVEGLYPHHIIVIYPGVAVNTGSVYKKLNLTLTRFIKIHSLPEFKGEPSITEALPTNDLEAAAVPDFPVIAAAKRALVDSGARVALMSGSGSSVFGLFRTEAEAEAARKALPECQGFSPDWTVFMARLLV
jgi:4-diphosphocytidyl-2-C-methyl-D-erythritol kinase